MRKRISLGLLLAYVTIGVFSSASAQSFKKPIQLFSLDNVKLLDGPFERAQHTNKSYLLALDPDRLLAPFLRESGLGTKFSSYTNWENTGLDGHVGGHYLTALSLMYASTKDAEIKERLDYFLAELKRCQDHLGTGYIGGVPGSKALWDEIQSGKIGAGNFDLNRKWVPLYNIHKTYAGLRDAYLIAGEDGAKDMLIKMTDWAIRLVQELSDEQIQNMLRSEHGGLNEIFADVAVITGDERYLKLAKQFTHQRFLNPLIQHKDELTGMHANTQIPKVIGVKRIADIDGNQSWDSAARFFWETVVENRSVAIGGNSSYEHFHPTNDFSNMIQSVEGPETCNTYNMLKLSIQLFQTEGNSRYVDYYEKALYNHILSSQHPGHGGFVYFTPMRPGHYRVYSQPQTSFWCCVGSGLENHSKYGEFIYAHLDNQLWVNLFIPSELEWKDKNVKIVQHTDFPENSSSTITINPKKSQRFVVNLRKPSWVEKGSLEIYVNNKKREINENVGEFIAIDRKWKKGDIVTVTFKMQTHVEQMPDSSPYYAFSYGPIVLASKASSDHLDGLLADDSRGGHIAKGEQVPLRNIPIVIGGEEQLSNLPERISAKELRFKLNNVYHNKQLEQRELVPFYQVHDARYILYWPQAVTVEFAAQRLSVDENAFVNKLDALTLDRVNAGQQQPESDHSIQYQDAETGLDGGMQYREAKGWFSYMMKNTQKKAKYLFIEYLDKDRPSEFEILLEGQLLSEVLLQGNQGVSYQVFSLPKNVLHLENIKIEFRASKGSLTTKLTNVRLLENKIDDQVRTSF